MIKIMIVIVMFYRMHLAVRVNPVMVVDDRVFVPVVMVLFPVHEKHEPALRQRHPHIAWRQVIILVAHHAHVFISIPDVIIRNAFNHCTAGRGRRNRRLYVHRWRRWWCRRLYRHRCRWWRRRWLHDDCLRHQQRCRHDCQSSNAAKARCACRFIYRFHTLSKKAWIMPPEKPAFLGGRILCPSAPTDALAIFLMQSASVE